MALLSRLDDAPSRQQFAGTELRGQRMRTSRHATARRPARLADLAWFVFLAGCRPGG